MKSPKNFKKRFVLYLAPAVFAFIVGTVGVRILSVSHAATLDITANEEWNDSNCSGSVNGAQTQYYGVAQGDSVNIDINNTSSTQTLDATFMSNDGIQGSVSNILPNSGAGSGTFSFSQWLEVNANSTTCSGGNNNSFLIIEAGSGSLSCNLTNNGQNWNITGNFENVVPNASIYSGSQLVGALNAVFYSNTHSSLAVNLTFGANTSGATYYLYNGPSSSSRQIGQISCPAATQATAAPTANTKKSAASPPNATANPATIPTPTDKATDTTASNASNTPLNSVAIKDKSVAIKSKKSSTPLVIIGATVLAVISTLFLLVRFHVIILPK